MYQIILYIFTFLFGLCAGSFLNVCIHRIPLGKNIIFPRSACPRCHAQLSWYHNIPLFSFLFLRARCAYCKQNISWRYPIVELLTASLFLLVVMIIPYWMAWPFYAFFMSALICSTFIDLDHWIIPDVITLPGIVIGLVSAFTFPEPVFLSRVLGVLLGGGILLFFAWAYHAVTKKEGLGGGDIKFLAMTGAFLGIQGALATLILSSILGSIIGIFLILFRGRGSKSAIPFGPFLALGALFAFLFGDAFWQWYFQVGRI